MHYITGTNFTVKRQTAGCDRQFILNQPYYVISILLQEGGKVQYLFKNTIGDIVKIPFESCRDADKFIARHRNESIPNYDVRYEEDRGD